MTKETAVTARQIPKYIKRQMLAAFKNKESFRWVGFYPVSLQASLWLTRNIVITSDCSETTLYGMTLRFNWHTESWYVSA